MFCFKTLTWFDLIIIYSLSSRSTVVEVVVVAVVVVEVVVVYFSSKVPGWVSGSSSGSSGYDSGGDRKDGSDICGSCSSVLYL